MGDVNSMGLPESGAHTASPASSGKSRWWIWLLVIAVIAVGFWYFRGRSASQAQSAPQSAPGATPGGAGRRGGGIGAQIVPVVVAASQAGDLPVYFNGLGTVTAFNTVTIRSRVDGQIIKINFTEGQFVHQGDSLVEIDPRPFQVQLEQAEGQLAKDQAQRKDAEVNLERFQLLFNEGVIPKQQLDTQAAQVGTFDGAIRSDQSQIDNAKLQLVYSRITAPIGGRVGLRLVDSGNIVHASDQNGLLVITQLQPISVIFSLPQDQLPQVNAKLRNGGQLTVDAFDRDDTSEIESGKLLTIDNQIDTTTGTYKLKATFDNSKNLLFPNQFVNIHLLVDIKKNLVIVPAAAIQRGPQGTYVFAVENGNTAKIKTVTIAQTTGSFVGLSAGLAGGETVVIDGQDKLQDGTKINPTAANSNGSPNASANPQQPSGNPTDNSGSPSGHKRPGQQQQPPQGAPSGKHQ
jgi:multidrug efflux system membrane fusion protein